jgi:hypothetical protein
MTGATVMTRDAATILAGATEGGNDRL